MIRRFAAFLLYVLVLASASAAPPTHRSLRDNASRDPPPAAEPLTFSGYAGAAPFKVVPQVDTLTFYPCTACHAAMTPNATPRLLGAPHVAALPHGRGRFWCLECHSLKNRDELRTFAGRAVGFDEAPTLCGQCHFRQHKDWYFGAHGKRVANWRGEREIWSCTHCHDPHDPTLKPRAPSPPPPVRAGLQPMPRREVRTP